MTMTTIQGGEYLAQATRFSESRAGDPAWLRELRDSGRRHLEKTGFPTTRREEWRYTNVGPLVKAGFEAARESESARVTASQADALGLGAWTPYRLVFVDGRLAAGLAGAGPLPTCVVFGSLAEMLEKRADLVQETVSAFAEHEKSPFATLNTALFADGAVVYVPRNTKVEAPLHILYVTTQEERMTQPRTLILAEEGADVSVVEQFVSTVEGAYFTNAVAEVELAAGSHVSHIRLQRESGRASHVSSVEVRQQRDSRYDSMSFSMGAALARHDIKASLDAQGAACAIDGLYMAAGNQHVDFHTAIIHAKPNGTSRELFKGILAGKATGVFNGRVAVPPNAQKTDSEQRNHNLLLSNDATINTKPELEIYADDVKCAHGATVGQLDEQSIFYMRSRGIPKRQAQTLLTHAFARDVLERVAPDALRDALDRLVLEWLPRIEERTDE